MYVLKDYLNIGTLVGVLLTLAVKELGEVIARRRANRTQIGRVLADLLEMRHSVVALNGYTRLLSKEAGIPEALAPQIRSLILRFVQPQSNIVQRYNATVDEIAGFNPLLAFNLRSKDVIQTFNQKMDQLSSTDPNVASSWQALGPDLNEVATKYVDQALIEIAWKFSPLAWYRVRRWLRRTNRLPAEVQTLLEKLKLEVGKAMAADAAAGEASTTPPQAT